MRMERLGTQRAAMFSWERTAARTLDLYYAVAGDPNRAPPFVAPYQPRVDFQLWFLLLGGPPRAPYFNTLIARLLQSPTAVAPLFSRDPFPDTPPPFIRVVFYRYTFTDVATRRATGAWWHRELLGASNPISRDMLRR